MRIDISLKEHIDTSLVSDKKEVRLQPIYRSNFGERKTVFNKHNEDAGERKTGYFKAKEIQGHFEL